MGKKIEKEFKQEGYRLVEVEKAEEAKPAKKKK